MQQFFSQLGIDWRLIISQMVDFGLLLFVLWYFLYKPIIKLLKDRKQKIEEGITKSKIAEDRLLEVDLIRKEKIKEAEIKAAQIIKKTEDDLKDYENKFLAKTKEKEDIELKDFQSLLAMKKEESEEAIKKEVKQLVKDAISKTVEISPSLIDDVLIEKAIADVKKIGVN
jgi:F-type H+-transporting ATPase subunit b